MSDLQKIKQEKRQDFPDRSPKCQWAKDSTIPSPHHHDIRKKNNKICETVLDSVGFTPLVRLNKTAAKWGIQCQLLAKCEYMNPGGSIKDRIAVHMIETAEKEGKLQPNYAIVELTSGNTGIGVALVAAIKGYRCVILMPDNMSKEKITALKALGAEVVLILAADWNSIEIYKNITEYLPEGIENFLILNQYTNPSNPLAHYDNTAEELLFQCDGKIDMLVAGAGTGGTITGISKKLKEKCPDIKIIGADPIYSILSEPKELNDQYKPGCCPLVEGIGRSFIPAVIDRSIIDRWYKCSDIDSFQYARHLIREEGLLCGGSSGCALFAALQAAQGLDESQICVVILPDSARNYVSKFVSDDWLNDKFGSVGPANHVNGFH